MKTLISLIILLSLASCTQRNTATNEGLQATIQIDLLDQKAEISPGLSGIFMEEINHAFDGGIYAELIQNRSFEEGVLPPGMKLEQDEEGNKRMELESLPDGVPKENWAMPWPWNGNCLWDTDRALVGWSLVNEEGSSASMNLTEENPMNEASSRSLEINFPGTSNQKTGASLINSGYWGINIQAGKAYELVFYLRAGSYEGSMEVRLEDPQGKTLASHSFESLLPNNSWKKFSASLTADGSNPEAKLVLSFVGSGKMQIDWVSLFPPTFKNTPNGLRPDLASYLEDLKPDFIRYPGGCYVEGLSWESAPDWRKMVSPPEERPGMWGYWKYRSTDGFGYHEFLKFSEQIGADAMYVAFAGMTVHPDNNWPIQELDTLIQQTMDAIEYAIGPTDSKWGSQRLAMGHAAPFPLKYVEIGNEHYTAEYGDYYVKFKDVIKAKYPDMVVIMSMYWSGLNRPAIKRAGDENIEMIDEHAYRDANWIRSNFDYFDKYERTPWSVYVGEYASHNADGNWLCGMSDATYIMMMEKNGDLVKMASYAPLFCNVNDKSWGINLIEFNSSQSFAHASYYVQKTFNENRPDVNVGISQELNILPDNESPKLGGEIGLGSWNTQTEFKNFEVYDAEGNLIFSDDFENINKWQNPIDGKWMTEGGVLKQTDPEQSAARIFVKDLQIQTGEIRVKARRVGGSEGFLVFFNVEKNDRFFFANYGAAGNAFSEVQAWGAPEGYAYKRIESTRGAMENDRWYDLRVVIKKDRAEMFLDGQKLSEAGVFQQESVFSIAGYDKEKESLVVKLVNYKPEPIEARIVLKGAGSVGKKGRQIVIQSDQLSNHNSLENPKNIIPQEYPIKNCSRDFKVKVLPYSVNTLLIPVKY